jgi:hypothetical protein
MAFAVVPWSLAGLRPTERPCDEIQKKLGNPRSTRAIEIGRAASSVKVLNGHRESCWRVGGSFAPQNVESEIGGRKPEPNNRCYKGGSVGPVNHVVARIALKKRLSLSVEARMDRALSSRLARLKHD